MHMCIHYYPYFVYLFLFHLAAPSMHISYRIMLQVSDDLNIKINIMIRFAKLS